jgi:ElaB/YqjD/DUF883 family membrane-anchored ribosome-binding protein
MEVKSPESPDKVPSPGKRRRLARRVHYFARRREEQFQPDTNPFSGVIAMADIKDRMKNTIDNVADKAKSATDKTADAAQGAKQDAHGLVDRVKEGAQGLADRAGEYAGQARDKVEEWAGEARDAAQHTGEKVQRWAGDAYDTTSHAVGDFGQEVTGLIRKHPIPALLIGFGVGLLIGRTARMV